MTNKPKTTTQCYYLILAFGNLGIAIYLWHVGKYYGAIPLFCLALYHLAKSDRADSP